MPVVEVREPYEIRGLMPHLGALLPILIAYFSLGFYQIGHQSLWLDEVISVQVASGEGFFSPVIWFRQSPLYFALLHVWAQLGSSEFVLRSLSVVFGGIAVCITYIMGVRLFNQRVAWIGTTILATSPFLIWYSQEVRYITLMIATSLLAMYTFQRALFTKNRWWWLSYFLSLILAIAAFKVNILLPFAQGVYLLCLPSHRPVLRKWLVCQVVVLTLFGWWINGGQYRELGSTWKGLAHDITVSNETKMLSSGGDREFELAAIPYTLFAFSTGFSMGPSVRELQVSRSIATLRPYAPLILFLGVLFGGLFVSGLIALWRQPEAGMFLIAWIAVPIIGASLISAFTDMAYNVRYVSMALPAYILILAAGIAWFGRPVVRMSLLSIVLLVNGFSLTNYYFEPSYARADSRSAVQYLESAASPQDIILVVGSIRAVGYYYKGDSPIVSWSRKYNNDDLSVTKGLQEITKSHDHLWLVEIRPWQNDPKGKVKATLEGLYTVIHHKHFPGVEIYSYDL